MAFSGPKVRLPSSVESIHTAVIIIPIIAVQVVRSTERMAYNNKLRRELCYHILGLINNIVNSIKNEEESLPQDLQEPIKKLTDALHVIQVELQFYSPSPESSRFRLRTRWKCFRYRTQVAEQLMACFSTLDLAAQLFQADSSIQSNLNASQIHSDAAVEVVAQHLEDGDRLAEDDMRRAEISIQVSKDAEDHSHFISQSGKGVNQQTETAVFVEALSKEIEVPVLPLLPLPAELPSAAIPPKLEIFHGRDEYVEDAVTTILDNPEGTRLAILGPGGIGKTSVSLAIIHDQRIAKWFKKAYHWIPCEQANSIPFLVLLIARSLDIKFISNDPMNDIKLFLRRYPQPRILIFDNLETPMDTEGLKKEVEKLIQAIASYPKVSIIITMRGVLRPCPKIPWTMPYLTPLKPLSLDAARQTFVDINPEVIGDPHLDDLLKALDCVPLAVTIIASLSTLGETPLELIGRFKSERSSMIYISNERLQSIDCSVSLSLTTPQMKANPEALILLEILSMLPGGAKVERLPAIAPQLGQSRVALNTLQHISLVYVTPDLIIRVLSPIRSFILDNHALPNPHRLRLYQYYYGLAERSRWAGTPEFLQTKQEMKNEEANMDHILLDALDQEDPRTAIVASTNYTWFLNAHIPRTDIILKAIKVAERPEYSDLLSECIFVKGGSEHGQSHYDLAIDDFTHAKQLYEDCKDQLGVAKCIQRLGNTLEHLPRLDEAQAHLQDAKNMFEGYGDSLGVARCLQSLGTILYKRGQYDEARSFLQDAKAKFEDTGDAHGVAQCLQSLGNILYTQYQVDGAQAFLQDAKTKFEDIGSALGVAQCLFCLGNILYKQEKYDEARVFIQDAKTKFEDIDGALGVAQCLQSLGNILHIQGQYDGAQAFLQDAKTKFDDIGEALGVAQCLRSLGDILILQHQYDDAQAFVQEAKTKFEDIGSPHGVAQCLRSLGDILCRQHQYDDAQAFLQDAKTKFEDIGSALGVAQCLLIIGIIFHMQNQSNRAQAFVQDAKTKFKDIGSTVGVAQCSLILCSILYAQDRVDEAKALLQEAKDKFESISNVVAVEQCTILFALMAGPP